MIKKILYVFVILSVVLVTGCNQKQIDYSLNIAEINSELNLLTNYYEDVSVLVVSKWDTLDAEDQNNIKLINQSVDRIIRKIDTLRSLGFYNITPAEIGYLHTLGRESYLLAKEIYLKNEVNILPSERIRIKMFDAQLKETDKLITEVLENPENSDINAAIANILTIASIGFKVLMPLII